VESAQRERIDAMMRQDVKSLDMMLDDDFTYAHIGGDLQTRPQFLNTIKKEQLVYESIAPTAVRVRVYDGLALVTGREDMRVRNSAGLSASRFDSRKSTCGVTAGGCSRRGRPSLSSP